MTDTPDDQKPSYADTLQAQLLAEYVSDGMTMIDACRTLGLDRRGIYSKLADDSRFADLMNKARDDGFDAIANDVRKVTRGEEGYSSGDAKRDKLIAEIDLKLLSKWHPKKYGEKLQVETKGATVAMPVGDDPIAAQRAYEELMKGS